jgi:hypothetical protein
MVNVSDDRPTVGDERRRDHFADALSCSGDDGGSRIGHWNSEVTNQSIQRKAGLLRSPRDD